MCFVKILHHWCTKQRPQVRWGNSESKFFHILNSGRQGGVISSCLFAVYFDDLSRQLRKVKSGSFVGNTHANHLVYTDDICCFLPSLDGLQDILNICGDFAEKTRNYFKLHQIT